MGNEHLKWFEKAREDLHAAEYNFKGGEFDVAAFLCQQAVEKALKALYLKKFSKLTKTHDLVFLANELGVPQKLVDYCKEVGPAFIYTRYPDIEEVTDMERTSGLFLAYAKEVIAWVESRI
ncbi:HEPN domain-containing protein [Candidatus Micrarchaeota archaeon]|nr:HEPN domain-containing protein [Candidatus Micrarchaeota archaeon]